MVGKKVLNCSNFTWPLIGICKYSSYVLLVVPRTLSASWILAFSGFARNSVIVSWWSIAIDSMLNTIIFNPVCKNARCLCRQFDWLEVRMGVNPTTCGPCLV